MSYKSELFEYLEGFFDLVGDDTTFDEESLHIFNEGIRGVQIEPGDLDDLLDEEIDDYETEYFSSIEGNPRTGESK